MSDGVNTLSCKYSMLQGDICKRGDTDGAKVFGLVS